MATPWATQKETPRALGEPQGRRAWTERGRRRRRAFVSWVPFFVRGEVKALCLAVVLEQRSLHRFGEAAHGFRELNGRPVLFSEFNFPYVVRGDHRFGRRPLHRLTERARLQVVDSIDLDR